MGRKAEKIYIIIQESMGALVAEDLAW